MTLEFNQIVPQVYKMGEMLEHLDFDLSESLTLARQRFEAAGDLRRAWERIEWVRQSDISGYRGAAPVDLPNAEPVNLTVPEPALPEQAVIVAGDGSQVYPDDQSPVHYYLLNIGIFTYFHGINVTPEQRTYPDLRFHNAHVHDRYGRIIANRTVDDRRTVEELRRLAEHTWIYREQGLPVVALYDNRLIYLPGNDADDGDQLLRNFLGAMVHLHDSGALLAGYVDNPFRGKRFMQLLYLLSLESEDELKQQQTAISRAGDLEGLRDQQFFQAVLKPGERSAIMVQNSPQNFVFRQRGVNYEIAFFYLKVYNNASSHVVRVDLPVWVARDPQQVDALHALILHQCRLQGRNAYPYALTRADELAWVGGQDRAKLDELVNTQIRRVKNELIGTTLTAKSRGKELARSSKRYHDMWGEEIIDER